MGSRSVSIRRRRNSSAKSGRRIFSPGRAARRSCSPTPRKPRFSPARTIPRPNARGSRRSILWWSSSAAQPGARRRQAPSAGEPLRRVLRPSTPPAPATPSSPPFWRRVLQGLTYRPGWSAPSPPALSLRQSLGADQVRKPAFVQAPETELSALAPTAEVVTGALLRRTKARLCLWRLCRVVNGAERDRPDEISRKHEPHRIAFAPAGIDRSNRSIPASRRRANRGWIKAAGGRRAAVSIEGRATVTCHAGGLGDKTLLGH